MGVNLLLIIYRLQYFGFDRLHNSMYSTVLRAIDLGN